MLARHLLRPSKCYKNRILHEIDLGNALLEPEEETVVDEEGEPTDFSKEN